MINWHIKTRRYARLGSANVAGFTLTELAIVIGIIATILGGIFVAAQSNQYRIRVDQGLDEINFIVSNMHALYAGRNAKASPVVAAGATTLIAAGVFPKEMISPTTGYANDPWDATAANGSAQISVNTVPGQFILTFKNLPADVCSDLMMKNSATGNDTGLQSITVTPGGTTCPGGSCTLPITAIEAATACPVGSVYAIQWVYSLGG